MDYHKLRKPEHLKEEIWHQHLRWMDVMGKQVDENFARHDARLKEDAVRRKKLLQEGAHKNRPANRVRSLFSR